MDTHNRHRQELDTLRTHTAQRLEELKHTHEQEMEALRKKHEEATKNAIERERMLEVEMENRHDDELIAEEEAVIKRAQENIEVIRKRKADRGPIVQVIEIKKSPQVDGRRSAPKKTKKSRTVAVADPKTPLDFTLSKCERGECRTYYIFKKDSTEDDLNNLVDMKIWTHDLPAGLTIGVKRIDGVLHGYVHFLHAVAPDRFTEQWKGVAKGINGQGGKDRFKRLGKEGMTVSSWDGEKVTTEDVK